MKTVRNKARTPLKIRLARGKVLRLGPGNEGQIATQDAERDSVKQLVEAGDLEILDDDGQAGRRPGESNSSRTDSRGHGAGSLFKKGGDR